MSSKLANQQMHATTLLAVEEVIVYTFALLDVDLRR